MPESVWDFPRPPRVEPVAKVIRVVLDGQVIAETTRAFRVLETSHPPVYYIPPADILEGALESCEGSSFCEFKGSASYWTVRSGQRVERAAAWFYPRPAAGFEEIRDHVAFYPARMDECTVDGEVARPQAGGFYGGWITSDLVGPFKGEPGTRGW